MNKNILIMMDKLIIGGAQNIAVNLAINLHKIYGYNVKIAVFDNHTNQKIDSIEIIDLNLGTSRSKIHKMTNVIKRIRKLKKIKKEYQITHTISFLTVPNFVNCMTRQKDKVIISIRNEMSKLETNKISTYMNKIAGKLSDVIVPVSKYVLKDEKENYQIDLQKMKVIYNFCDQDKITKMAKEKTEEKYQKIFEDHTVIMNVGRLEPQKGQENLIKAFREVANRFPDTVLVILGEGSKRNDLQKMIQKNCLEDRVYLLGYQENPYKYMKKSDIFVLTSLFEGMPNVVLEAMALGLPIISTYCNPGIKEILEKNPEKREINRITETDYGIIVPVCNNKRESEETISDQERELAEAIGNLVKDKEKASHYGKVALDRIKEFSIGEIMPKWNELLK